VTAADRVIRWTTAGAVVGVAAVAAVASYEHAYALVRAHGESGWTARMVPLTVDGLIHASSIGLIGAAVGAWPAVALVGSNELLMLVIRSSQVQAVDRSDSESEADPLQEEAAELFAEQLAADRIPSIRAILAQLHVGQPRAHRLRDCPSRLRFLAVDGVSGGLHR
jgi:Protein of unknown function (DUF2637)